MTKKYYHEPRGSRLMIDMAAKSESLNRRTDGLSLFHSRSRAEMGDSVTGWREPMNLLSGASP